MSEPSSVPELPRKPLFETKRGRLVAVDAAALHVDYPGNAFGPLRASRLRSVRRDSLRVDDDVLLVFEDHDPARPVIVGALVGDDEPDPPRAIRTDGDRVVVEAPGELVLRCGPCTLTLTAEGRLKLRADNILSFARRRHLIRGGVIRLN